MTLARRSTCKRSSSSYRTVKGPLPFLSVSKGVLVPTNPRGSEFDVVFLRQQGVKFPKWHLTAPIRRDSRVRLSYGASVAASDLLGKQILDRTVDDKGNAVAIHEPTLASYVVNSDRAATPVRFFFSFFLFLFFFQTPPQKQVAHCSRIMYRFIPAMPRPLSRCSIST